MSTTEQVTVGTLLQRTGNPEGVREAGLLPIDLSPDFQRTFEAWNNQMKTRMIETALNGHMMNPIWTIKVSIDGKLVEEVLDGQHRTKTIISFVNNEFPLNGSYFIDQNMGQKYNKKYYRDLGEDQEIVRMYKLTVNILHASFREPEKLAQQYELLNRSTKPLNEYEFRKPILVDFYNIIQSFIPKFQETFLLKSINDKRGSFCMELINLLAFSYDLPPKWNSANNYSEKWMDENVGDTAKKVQNYLSNNTDKLKQRMDIILFCINKMQKLNFSLTKSDKTFLKILISRIVYHLETRDKISRFLNTSSDIFKDYINLTEDSMKRKTLGVAPNTTLNPAGWQHHFRNFFDRVISSEVQKMPPRHFNEKIKEQKLKIQKNTCPVCKKLIQKGDKTEADHIKAWVEGGSSELGNCDILHAECHKKRHNKC